VVKQLAETLKKAEELAAATGSSEITGTTKSLHSQLREKLGGFGKRRSSRKQKPTSATVPSKEGEPDELQQLKQIYESVPRGKRGALLALVKSGAAGTVKTTSSGEQTESGGGDSTGVSDGEEQDPQGEFNVGQVKVHKKQKLETSGGDKETGGSKGKGKKKKSSAPQSQPDPEADVFDRTSLYTSRTLRFPHGVSREKYRALAQLKVKSSVVR